MPRGAKFKLGPGFSSRRSDNTEAFGGNNERVWRAARKIVLSAYAWNAEQRTGLINATAPFLLLFSPPSPTLSVFLSATVDPAPSLIAVSFSFVARESP